MDHNNTRNCSRGKIIRFLTRLWGKVNVSSFEQEKKQQKKKPNNKKHNRNTHRLFLKGQFVAKNTMDLGPDSNLDFMDWALAPVLTLMLHVLSFVTSKTRVIFKITNT